MDDDGAYFFQLGECEKYQLFVSLSLIFSTGECEEHIVTVHADV